MAVGQRAQFDDSDDLDNLSQESDFYGGAATKAEYTERVNSFDVVSWWNNKTPSLTEVANKSLTTAQKDVKDAAKLYNIYEGNQAGRQLTEKFDEFMLRLPPRTTEQTDAVPWIYIANPYIPRKSGDVKQEGIYGEGPPEEGEDILGFITAGQQLLEELEEKKHAVGTEMKGMNASTVSRTLNKHKEDIIRRIRKAAVEMKCTTGKWLLFTPPESVNEVWECVARATMDNELGIAAKVSPFQLEQRRQDRVICIYTKDFEDKDDLARVVKKMQELRLIDNRGKAIYYKPDAYTYLDLKRDNLYDIKPSLYSSTEFLLGKSKKVESRSKRKLAEIID
ncbi:hypothetical protein PVAG01_02918 [Phlyctema vagabunda]|uniref:DUF1917-domain-containing protein n=1 Tax=Phlyctema vagabunda TaxID=108571 RepID=A0ABR4PSI8_9HELO